MHEIFVRIWFKILSRNLDHVIRLYPRKMKEIPNMQVPRVDHKHEVMGLPSTVSLYDPYRCGKNWMVPQNL